jgi:hypothetical protein
MNNVVNVDTVQPLPGDLVRISTQANGVLLASSSNTTSASLIRGVWIDAPRPGLEGQINSNTELEVNTLELCAVGDSLFLSATPGKATKTSPAASVYIGTVYASRSTGGTNYKATISLDKSGEGTAGSAASLDSNGLIIAAQLPLATANTQGAMPRLSWAQQMLAIAQKYAPTIKEFDSQRMGLYPNANSGFTTGISDAGIAGCATVISASVWRTLSGAVATDPSTTPFCFAMRGFWAVGSNKITQFMLGNADHSKTFGLLTYSGYDATKLCVVAGSAHPATTFVCDASEHDFLFVFDGAVATALVDGTAVGTVTSYTNPPTTVSAICAYSDNGLTIRRYGFGW